MKILINRKPVAGPWGGGNLFVKSFCDFMISRGHQITHSMEQDIDLIFMQDPRYSDLGISVREIAAYKAQFPNTRVVHRVNECDARKGTHDMDFLLRECSKITDATIFVSHWMKDYHVKKGWFCTNTPVVYNGTNTDHFKPREKINNGKINLVTHHWSDNPMKGADVYDFLDEWIADNEGYTFTYIGRYKKRFKHSRLLPPLAGEDLGKELSKYDVYVSGSRFDPGPNHIIESIACGLPTLVHHEGGGAVEFAGPKFSFKNQEELVSLIQNIPDASNNLAPITWEACMSNVLGVLESL